MLSECFLPAKITLFFLQGHVLSPYLQHKLPPTKYLKLLEMLKHILCNIPTRLQVFGMVIKTSDVSLTVRDDL